MQIQNILKRVARRRLFKLSSHSHLLQMFAMRFNGYTFTALRPWEEIRGLVALVLDKIQIRRK